MFFPEVCETCSVLLKDNEKLICTDCRHELPVTDYHKKEDDSVKKILYGRVKLQHATALLHFSKRGVTQQLLHKLKYKGHENIGVYMGKWMGTELKACDAYRDIDVVVPVPLHKKKLRKRGYNQVAKFGKEIAAALNIDYNDKVLLKRTSVRTQVFKSRTTRYNEDDNLFEIQNGEQLMNKNILLVDDIITTGATVEACAHALNKIEGIRLSLATLAIAD